MKMKKANYLKMFVTILIAAIVATGCSSKKPAEPQQSTETAKPRVAFVFNGPYNAQIGWLYENARGVKFMEEQLGIKADIIDNIPEGPDSERVMTQLAQNHDIVFAISFGFMDYMDNVAKKFPKVKFMNAFGYKTADNYSNYNGNSYEGSYLTGIVAGSMTKNKKIGYVGTFPIPNVIYNINAFTLGVKSVQPDATVKVVWTNTWIDASLMRQAATGLMDQGVDVIVGYGQAEPVLELAEAKGVFTGGIDSDMVKYAPKYYMTNATWDFGSYYTKVVKSVMDGTWTNEPYMGSMKDGLIGIAPIGPNIPAEVKQKVEEAKKKIIDGTLNIFTGPITSADGKTNVEAGKTLTGQEIQSMTWLVKGTE